VQNALALENLETAAGYLENSKTQINVRTVGEGLTPAQVGDVLIKKRGGETIYNSRIHIRDVARVEDGLNDIQRMGVIQGGTGVALAIKKQRGANAVAVATAVKAKLQELKKSLPKDTQIEVNFDSTTFISDAIHETLFTLLLSALVTGIICYLFLGSWSSTFNVLLSIPTSVMGTFIVMYFMGFTLNFFTLLGLSLAIGIVVDDAIMVLENITRHFESGKDRMNASRDGAREITFAAVAATAAVMAIFLPVAFMEGIIGKFFFQFGITISAAVLLSLLEAITITPMRCSQMMSHSGQGRFYQFTNRVFDSWSAGYRKTLEVALHWRWVVIGLSLALFLLSLLLGSRLPEEFLPTQDQGAFLIRVETPVGSSLEYTASKLVQAESLLKKHPEVSRFYAAIGGFALAGGAPAGDVSDNAVNVALIYITLQPQNQRHLKQYQLMSLFREELNAIPGLKAIPQDLSSRSFTAGRGFPIELSIRGPRYETLESTAKDILARLQQTGMVQDLNTDLRTGIDEVQLIPDRDAAAQSGVSVDSIANTISAAIGGATQGQFTNGDRRYDVRLRLEGLQRGQVDDIQKLDVRTSANELIPISQVVHSQVVPTFQTLTRRLRERSISIFANVTPGTSQAMALDNAERIAKAALPAGYRLFLGGGAQTFRETFTSLSFALWLGIIVAYMVLASQFNSFVHPFTVLLALPFSVSGAFLALLLTHQSLNLYSMIGLILLMGIVKKNSILLVEFANRQRHDGTVSARDAMLIAGPVRLRPILMTSFATLAAAIPPALALGPGAESRIPLAITVIGGIIVSTALTLLVIPCAYSLLSGLEHHPHKPGPSA